MPRIESGCKHRRFEARVDDDAPVTAEIEHGSGVQEDDIGSEQREPDVL